MYIYIFVYIYIDIYMYLYIYIVSKYGVSLKYSDDITLATYTPKNRASFHRRSIQELAV